MSATSTEVKHIFKCKHKKCVFVTMNDASIRKRKHFDPNMLALASAHFHCEMIILVLHACTNVLASLMKTRLFGFVSRDLYAWRLDVVRRLWPRLFLGHEVEARHGSDK